MTFYPHSQPPKLGLLSIPLLFGIAAACILVISMNSTSQWWPPIGVLLSAISLVSGLRVLLRPQSPSRVQWSWTGFVRLGLFALAVTVVGGVPLLAYVRAYSLVHPPHLYSQETPEEFGMVSYYAVNFRSADGLALHGWYVPPRNGAVLIYVHGFAANRDALLGEASLISKHGYGALLMDMRNSGESEGTTNTFGLREADDVRAAVAFLRTVPDGDKFNIGVYGHSAGSAAVLLAAADTPTVRVVIAQSSFTSLQDNIDESFAKLSRLPSFPFEPMAVFFGEQLAGVQISQVRPIDAISTLSPRPVLLIHGEADQLISVENAHRMFAAAHEPKELYIVPGAGHNAVYGVEPEVFEARVVSFLDQYLLAH